MPEPNPSPLREALAERIRTQTTRKKLTVEQLADLAGVGRSSMWRVLRCENSPTVDWLGKVADALGCRPSDLVP